MDFENTQGPNPPEQPDDNQPTQSSENTPPEQPQEPTQPEVPTRPAHHEMPPQSEPAGAAIPPQQPPHNIPDFSMPVYDPSGQKKKKGSGWKVFWGIVITLSLLANGVMFLGIIGMAAMSSVLPSGVSSSSSAQENLQENVLVGGAKNKKIAVININGLINDEMSLWVRKQMKRCGDDPTVRGLIVRINSPGGMVSSSDQIHYEINKFKEGSNKPVLCFMHGIAASGGYYSAVACDEIMAEPTVITGSIGVIMNVMVIKELLEEKLGIDPVTIKSGRRKDWPSMYNETTDEQKEYLDDKIIKPAYNRFVELIVEGRKDVLNEQQIRELADGSIFSAIEARDNKLIDEVGYFDEAVDRVQQMANISGAQVVEYQEIFSVWNMFGAEARAKKSFNIETELLERVASPKIMYLWDGRE